MNKGEFVDSLSVKADLSRAHTHVPSIVVGLIIDSLASNKEIHLTSFGKLVVRVRRFPKKINPQIQKQTTVLKKVVAAFKSGENLMDIVAKN